MTTATTVAQLLEGKGRRVFRVSVDESVFTALKVLADRNVGAVLVFEGEGLAGVFSEREYARRIALQGKSSKNTPVRDIMRPVMASVGLADSIERCMSLMTQRHVRHLPVIEKEKTVGVVSIGDVVKAMISEQEFIIEQLESYITGLPTPSRDQSKTA